MIAHPADLRPGTVVLSRGRRLTVRAQPVEDAPGRWRVTFTTGHVEQYPTDARLTVEQTNPYA